MEELRRSLRSPCSDESLARRVAQGDDGAFDGLRLRYGRGLSRYAARLAGDDLALGEEIARQALCDARRALRHGARPACVSPWLYRLTLSRALQLRGTRPGHEAVPARLPERQRQAFVLREMYGLSMAEIAAELGLSAGEVEQAQFAARRRLAAVASTGRARRVAEDAPPPPARRPTARRAVLAVAAAAVALCVGMPVAATYARERAADPPPALATASLAERAR